MRVSRRRGWIWMMAALLMAAVIPLPGQVGPGDERLTEAVTGRIQADDSVDASDIRVRVREGIALLEGRIGTLAGKRRAEELAEAVPGIRSVSNRLSVRARPGWSDARIQDEVAQALMRNPVTERQDLLIDVAEGLVTLAGRVQSWPEQQVAGQVAAGVAGVRGVDNRIQVHDAQSRPDEEIRADVAARLRWDARLHGDAIEVRVKDGAVRLSGQVARASAKRRAEDLAWASGVRSVDNDGIRVVWQGGGDEPEVTPAGLLDDRDIARAVRDALGYDTRVAARQVAVDVDDGRITLSGSVPSITARRAAGDLASNTAGARAVVNQLQVKPGLEDLADEEIAGRIRAGLLASPFTEVYQIDVEVVDGQAILIGNVHTRFEREEAARIAEDVVGVTEVDNRLRVE